MFVYRGLFIYKCTMKHEITKQRLQELAAINNPFLRNEAMETPMAAASEMLSLLAHPDMKRSMDALSDMIDDQQFMAIKKLYDGLYMELKKHE